MNYLKISPEDSAHRNDKYRKLISSTMQGKGSAVLQQVEKEVKDSLCDPLTEETVIDFVAECIKKISGGGGKYWEWNSKRKSNYGCIKWEN